MNRTSLPTLLQKLNWRGDTRLIGLVGRAPVWDARASLKADQGWDFSSTLSAREQVRMIDAGIVFLDAA